MQMSQRAAIIGFLWLAAIPTASAQRGTSDSGLVGTWRLVSAEERTEDGSTIPLWGSAPAGRLIYDDRGRMSVQLMDPRRKPFASEDRLAGTAAEMRGALEGYDAYFGSYAVDAQSGVVVHRVIGSLVPNLIGTDQRRFFVLSGNRLTLTTPPFLRGARRSTYVLVWEREGQNE
jgi:hypothetical protein